MRISRTATAVATVLLAAGLAGCGSDAEPSSTSTGPQGACTADDVTVTGAPASEPTITIPDTCTPPTTLVVKDLAPGSGAPVAEGGTLSVNYSLVTWSDKKTLDTSWSRGEPYPLTDVGHSQVIDGWNQGVIGMKAGGRRLLIIPPALGYGEGGNGVAPNETLVFVLDAVSVS